MSAPVEQFVKRRHADRVADQTVGQHSRRIGDIGHRYRRRRVKTHFLAYEPLISGHAGKGGRLAGKN